MLVDQRISVLGVSGIEIGVEMSSRLFHFVGGETGPWEIARMETVSGKSMERAERLQVFSGLSDELPVLSTWVLRGVSSYERYVTRHEREMLTSRQPALGRLEATCATLIPIRKSDAWWGLPQDERRTIFEEHSRHIHEGLKYLPAIARRLHHCRDLGEEFDFLTWFEYAPSDQGAFDQLVRTLRASEEWSYVEREIDIRLIRTNAPGT